MQAIAYRKSYKKGELKMKKLIERAKYNEWHNITIVLKII